MRRLKKAFLQDPIVLAAPLQTPLDKRPFTLTILSPSSFSLDAVQKVALALLLIPTVLGFLGGLFSGDWTIVGITGFLLLLIGFMVWIIKLRSEMVWKVMWGKDSVTVKDGRYGATETWTEPLTAFTGLHHDFGILPRGGQYTPNRKVHGLLLTHREDPFKHILLHASYDKIEDNVVAYYEAELEKRLQ
ncbi:MAG: hypothetical protein AAF614_20430 [Chloroflexota bacterium]